MISLVEFLNECITESDMKEGFLQDTKTELTDADEDTKIKALEKYINTKKLFSGFGGKRVLKLLSDVFCMKEDNVKTIFDKFDKTK